MCFFLYLKYGLSWLQKYDSGKRWSINNSDSGSMGGVDYDAKGLSKYLASGRVDIYSVKWWKEDINLN